MIEPSVVHLTGEDVLAVAGRAWDGEVMIRDAGLLVSAAHRPSASVSGQDAYPDIFGKAAALLQSLAVDHPLVDGNERTAWLSCVTFLSINGVRLRPDIDRAEDLILAVATGALDEVKLIAERLRSLCDESPGAEGTLM